VFLGWNYKEVIAFKLCRFYSIVTILTV
jgi:hypothetical protein